jgi:metal-responsive CopG/Arc/MetJ family transcriptional regulator
MTAEKVTIKIPRELYHHLKQMIKDTGFSSVNEFIVFVMRSIASGSEMKKEDNLTSEEVNAIRGRLKKLGYLKD